MLVINSTITVNGKRAVGILENASYYSDCYSFDLVVSGNSSIIATGGSGGEFNTLYQNTNYNNYTKYKTALSLPLSGYFIDGSPSYQGSLGYWWSSTYNNSYNMYRLYLGTSGIDPTYYGSRYGGNSLRCLLGV